MPLAANQILLWFFSVFCFKVPKRFFNSLQGINMSTNLAIFENYKIRRHFDGTSQTWFFSVVDVVQILTQQPDYQTARKYWNNTIFKKY